MRHDKKSHCPGVSPRRRFLMSLFGLGVCLSLTTFAPAAQKSEPEPAQNQKANLEKATQNTQTIGLDTVLRLAESQNPQIAVARARLDDAVAESDQAAKKLLHPKKKAEAEGKVYQQQAELAKVITETLLDAAGTYFDWLAARTGQRIVDEQLQSMDKLLEHAKKLASEEKAAQLEVTRIQGEQAGRKESGAKLRHQAAAAAAKLIYLLGLDPTVELQPLDQRLAPVELINADRPVSELVAQALAQGPGVREMEELLAFVEQQANRACTAGQQQVLQAKIEVVQLSYRELQAKLTLGVQEARETILGGKEEIRYGQEQIDKARDAYEQSNKRLNLNVPGSTHSEVLLSLQALALAQANYLNAVRDYNKAQVRLMILLGRGAKSEDRGVKTEQRISK
jgi:outer membrane protein TolC